MYPLKDWSEYRPDKFKFNGKWIGNWFSNFVESPITINGITYRSVENFYQAKKSQDEMIWRDMAQRTPSQAKQLGKRLSLRPNWDIIKYQFMLMGLMIKFNQPIWKQRLIDTEDEILIEWNNWGDKIWGVSDKDNMGCNALGVLLMEIRWGFINELKH